MFGPPRDAAGECNARLEIGDDYGDNSATMRCQLTPGHGGRHREVYNSPEYGEVLIEWERGRMAGLPDPTRRPWESADEENQEGEEDQED